MVIPNIRSQSMTSVLTDRTGAEALLHARSDVRPMRVVCVGAHPDDAEAGCGGTLARLADAGHHVTILYLTKGEAGTKYLPEDDACWRAANHREAVAALRTAEAEMASAFLGVRALFWDQPDGETCVNPAEYCRFNALLSAQKPDVVFSHWPIDSHPDHRNASQLTYHAWQSSGGAFQLVYYEVMTGIQTQQFQPNWFVDVSQTLPRKRSACFAHRSQKPDRFCTYHERLERLRGEQALLERAEAFTVLKPSTLDMLSGDTYGR